MPANSSASNATPPEAVERPVHFNWIQDIYESMQREYPELQETARRHDSQRSGHGAETGWANILRRWLPPQYGVGVRKYILSEKTGIRPVRETDLVIFHPSYPEALRERHEILSGGVAAAFSVKLTLNKSGLDEGFSQIANLKGEQWPTPSSVKEQMLGTFPCGILAYSHGWKSPTSKPIDAVNKIIDGHHQRAQSPRHLPDFVCVADLATWTASRSPFVSSMMAQALGYNAWDGSQSSSTYYAKHEGAELRAGYDPLPNPTPIGSFLTDLLNRLSYSDPSVIQLARVLRATGTAGFGYGSVRIWPTKEIIDIRATATDLRDDIHW